ncbi:AMP-binding protein, partial [Streptomyces sp. NPDC097610]|uniref:AMP-binding protein n=1 Tax=Streptomyces sp. NPDC097610 TaxID=3157227 RepID=UPI00332C6E98
GTHTTYRELIERVNATAGAPAARGIGVRSMVGLPAPNSSLFAVAFHGILRAGATATTINTLFTAHGIAKQLADVNATMLITMNALLTRAQEAARSVGITPENLTVLDGDGAAATARGSTHREASAADRSEVSTRTRQHTGMVSCTDCGSGLAAPG